MRRRSMRELERQLENLDLGRESDVPPDLLVVHEDPETGAMYRGHGPDAERIAPARLNASPARSIIIRHEVVKTEPIEWEE